MMTEIGGEALALVVAVPFLAVVMQVTHSASERLHRHEVAGCIVRMARMLVAEQEPCDRDIRALRMRFTGGVMLDATLFLSEHIYGGSLHRLLLIVEVCEVDYRLLRSMRWRGAAGRSREWSKVARLTPSVALVGESELALNGRTDDVRLYAVATLLAAHPECAVRHISRLEHSLTRLEALFLVQRLRRGGLPIAYRGWLNSQNRNLQLMGVTLCELFADGAAERQLQRLLRSEDEEVALASLYALCSLGGDVATPQAECAFRALAPHHRAAFLRHAVQSCYSLRSFANLLSREERTRFAQQVESYKCQIVCN